LSNGPVEVSAAVIEDHGRILLALRPNKPGKPGGWEFPGGKRKVGETFSACAQREIKEELAASIVPTGIVYDHTTNIRLVGVSAKLQGKKPTPLEHDLLAWAKRSELLNYALLPNDIPLAKALQENTITLPRTAPPEKLALYIHVPFCLRKCRYCAFFSHPPKKDEIAKYTDDLIAQIKALLPMMPYRELASVYFGGGTPSILPGKALLSVCEAVKASIRWTDDIECTLEANPAAFRAEDIKLWQEAGINRVSLGVQSLQDNELKYLGRLHTAKEAEEAYQTLRKNGFKNISLDLMYGLPHQTISSWQNTVSRLLSWQPEHISFYALSIEKGTPLAKEDPTLPSDVTTMKEYWLARKLLKEQGYEMYEISNAAKPGFHSRHNSSYWDTNNHYLGLGPGAHSFCRFPYKNAPLRAHIDSNWKIINTKPLNKIQKLGERIYLGLRKTEGVQLTPQDEEIFKRQIEDLAFRKLVTYKGRTLKLTNRGIELANQVMSEFV
jgi:oxygen-independent coproporphyrinogen-3 oxidase